MKINMRTDYSYLFSNISGNRGNSAFGMDNFLADYASIKNGSYGKLMKAYFAKPGSKDTISSMMKPDKNQPAAQTATKKELSQVQTDSDALKASADAMLKRGRDSVFTQKEVVSKDEAGNDVTTKQYDTNAIYQSVNSFVKDYNALVKSADTAGTNRISNGLNAMTNTTKVYEKMLSQAGITVNEDKTLSIDEAAFKKSDMSKVQTLFQGAGSYGYSVSAKASMLNFYASSEANKLNTYNVKGGYFNGFSEGSLYNGYM